MMGYDSGVKIQDARLACWRDENTGRTTGMTALTELQSVQRRDILKELEWVGPSRPTDT